MKIYFVEDENGIYYSEDRARRFRKLSGEEAYSFLKSEIGKTKRFMKINDSDDSGDDVYFEVPKKSEKEFRKYERRNQYIADNRRDSTVGVYSFEEIDENWEEIMVDDSVNVEEEIVRKLDRETIYKALDSLPTEDKELITALYLLVEPMSEPEYAAVTGIPQSTISYRKIRSITRLRELLKKYF